ncbi:hypothetical protein SLS58_002662 [Diplodia intermedia]|uniref:Uncharacterized protein n=1 Tax=Diplodia intermedia TaxID=856260 RepID=A0ABR3TY41_9PEZI
MTTSSAPDPTITIKTRSGRVLDLPAIEETVHNGLVRRERELTSRRVKIKATTARMANETLAAGRLAKRKLSAAFKH